MKKSLQAAKQPMVEAFGYLRVSGRGQLRGDGFPRQKEAIQRYAAANGCMVVRWFEERAVPGATEWEHRPAWTEMIQQLNGVRTIFVEKVDRLARDLGVQEWILKDLKQRAITLVSATEENLDADPTRVMFRQILGAISQYEKAMIVLKLRAARKRKKAETGRCEGRQPYGELSGEAALLMRMKTLRSEGWTYDAIANVLNAEGVPTRFAGKSWFGSTVAKILRRELLQRHRDEIPALAKTIEKEQGITPDPAHVQAQHVINARPEVRAPCATNPKEA